MVLRTLHINHHHHHHNVNLIRRPLQGLSGVVQT